MSSKITASTQKEFRNKLGLKKKIKITNGGRNTHLKNIDETTYLLRKLQTIKKKKKKKTKRKKEKTRKRPRKKSASLKRKLLVAATSEKITKESPEQTGEKQQEGSSNQFFLQSFSPQIPTESDPKMGPPGNHGYRTRGHWPPYYRNYYPRERNGPPMRRWRSHLDDIYLPNYDDEDLEDRDDYSKQRFHVRRPYWYKYKYNMPQGTNYRNSFNKTSLCINKSPFKQFVYADSYETEMCNSFSNGDVTKQDKSSSSISANSRGNLANGSVRNLDKVRCKTIKRDQTDEVLKIGPTSDLKTSENNKCDYFDLNKMLRNNRENDTECHNIKMNLKTDNACDRSYTASLVNTVSKSNTASSTSVSSNQIQNMIMTEELYIHKSPNNSKGASISPHRSKSPTREDRESLEVSKSQHWNLFTAFREIDSDEETVCFDDFITIDKIDTAKSYLRSSVPSDNYDIVDMDISPFKRKSESNEDMELTKKTKFDNVYCRINSEKLLKEVNEVLNENKQCVEKTRNGGSKRCRSKSFSLNNMTENKSILRSLSMDSVDKNKFQVEYNFDLRTNLLLLLNQNSTDNCPNDFNNILTVLKENKNKKLLGNNHATAENVDISERNATNNHFCDGSGTNQVVNDKDCESYIEKNPLTTLVEPKIKSEAHKKMEADATRQDITKTKFGQETLTGNNSNEKNDNEQNTIPFLNIVKNDCDIRPKIEKADCLENNPKRKSSFEGEIPTKKICLNSTEETVIQFVKSSDLREGSKIDRGLKKEQFSTVGVKTTECMRLDSVLEEPKNHNVNGKDKVNVCSNGKPESMVDIEEELKSLLKMENSYMYQEKCSNNKIPENSNDHEEVVNPKVTTLLKVEKEFSSKQQLVRNNPKEIKTKENVGKIDTTAKFKITSTNTQDDKKKNSKNEDMFQEIKDNNLDISNNVGVSNIRTDEQQDVKEKSSAENAVGSRNVEQNAESEKSFKKGIRQPGTEKINQSEKKEKQSKARISSVSAKLKSKQKSIKECSVVDREQKPNENNFRESKIVDKALPASISQTSVNKTEILQKPREGQSISKSKTVSYHEYFKKIQSLFGSDSESEMEEEKLIHSKTNHSTDKKRYSDSNKEIKSKKQVLVAGINTNVQVSDGSVKSKKSVDPCINRHERHFSRNRIQSSKTIEKRRCSADSHTSSLKCSNDTKIVNQVLHKNDSNVSSVMAKRIEKKRRETLPASLIDGNWNSNSKVHQVDDIEIKNTEKRKELESPINASCSNDSLSYKNGNSGNLIVIVHKLKDPRKECYRFKNSGKKEHKEIPSASQIKILNKQSAVPDSTKSQLKNTEKHKPCYEKKHDTLQNTILKTDIENRKKSYDNSKKKVKNNILKEKDNLQKDSAINSTEKIEIKLEDHTVQLQSKNSQDNQTHVKIDTLTVAPKELNVPKTEIPVALALKRGAEKWEELKFLQCLSLSKQYFPELQRASLHFQENDCCDRAFILENVDVSDRIDIIKQVFDQDDDVIEIKQNIPIIDLTDDSIKQKTKSILKSEILKDINQEIPCKSNDMITLYRSEETVNSALDVQVTSESISPIAFFTNKYQTQDSEGTPSDGYNQESNCANPTSYISPLSNKTVNALSPAQFNSDSTKRVDNAIETQNVNGSVCNIITSPSPTSSQILKNTGPISTNKNIHVAICNPRSEVRNDIQINLAHNCGSRVEINQVNVLPQIPVQKHQESVIKPPIKITSTRQNMAQHNPVPASDPLTQVRMRLNNITRMMDNHMSPVGNRPNSGMYHEIMMNANDERRNSYGIHGPMRHRDGEGPAPMHEISPGEIRKVGLILIKYLYFFNGLKKAQWAYTSELQKIHKLMPYVTKVELYQFENYTSEKYKRLCRDLIKELKGLNLTVMCYNIVTLQMLMEYVFNVLRKMVGTITISWIYLMLESLMQSEVSEYMSVPFLRDLYYFVGYITNKIRNSGQVSTQAESTQVVITPQDPFTLDQRKLLERQINEYILICSNQRRLTDEFQNIHQPNNLSNITNVVQPSNNSVGRTNSNLTVHQNIVIRQVETLRTHSMDTNSSINLNTNPDVSKDTYKIRLPYSEPHNKPSSSADSSQQKQNSPQLSSEINFQVNSSNMQSSALVDSITPANSVQAVPQAGPVDSVKNTTGSNEIDSPDETTCVTVKQEKKALLLTDQEIEIIDLTWINNIDPKQLQTEMEYIAVKKEEPGDEAEEEEVELNEEVFAVAPSPSDSGISSPPMQVEYDETVFSNRACICGKIAEYVCGCIMAMYCSVECQMEDWKAHKDVCLKHKVKPNKDSTQAQHQESLIDKN